MPLSTVVTGITGKTYYLSTGTRATWAATPSNGIYNAAAPSGLVEMSVIRNVTSGANADKADVSSRQSLFKLSAPAQYDGDAEFDIPWTPSDGGFQAMRNAFWSRSTVALLILDGDKATSGSQGLWGDFMVIDFPREEPIDNAMMSKVKVSPAASSVAPQWVVCN